MIVLYANLTLEAQGFWGFFNWKGSENMNKIALIIVICLLSCTTLLAKVTYVSYKDDVTYTSQLNTGSYSTDNCGIASLKMALDYIGVKTSSVSDLRNQIKPRSGWIYTDELETYMDDRNILYRIEGLDNKEVIKKCLDDGILLMCLDMSRVSAPYSNVTGHFIIVVGYYIDDRGEWLEVYDPTVYNTQYYKLDEVYQSAKDWCGYMYQFK